MSHSEDPLRRSHPRISIGCSGNERILILNDNPVRLIKWPKAGLEGLLPILCFKRRIMKVAIRGNGKK